MHDPTSDTEWQEAVDEAELCLLIDSAQKYELVTGPTVNIARAEEILTRGRDRGITPRPHEQLVADAFGASPPDPLTAAAAAVQHATAGVAAFTDDMREQGIHVGVNGTCVCGQPWPCDAGKKATS